jgi:hypothetical protein
MHHISSIVIEACDGCWQYTQTAAAADRIVTGRGREQISQTKLVEGIGGSPAMCPAINCDIFGVGDGEQPARAIVRWPRWKAARSLLAAICCGVSWL